MNLKEEREIMEVVSKTIDEEVTTAFKNLSETYHSHVKNEGLVISMMLATIDLLPTAIVIDKQLDLDHDVNMDELSDADKKIILEAGAQSLVGLEIISDHISGLTANIKEKIR